MIIHESVFLYLEFFKEDSLIGLTWLPTTEDMTDEEHQRELLKYLDFVLELKPKRALNNSKNFLFTTSPTMQEWIDDTILTPSTKVGLTKIAIVMTQEFITGLAIEQLIDTALSSQEITLRSFEDKEEAKEWLLSASK
ncbi:hypothetical protein Fleli_3830 [Bernardetia litoralis DSM 6794]|uniref:STAS/SEC14 domain-containing protein n=1 Tax=Bernardetia litoralis (strain ATCC 23117 / DSM 6794 / NBRC 15988 / NCIMB 1366 / Fx l1 / Sio-4) TaxID=880071 RepID=I4AQA1_BERLS|nr:hypothetical protein [Bernardetia litoralis]AFM06136.1 hypothetical protein Fleli_3830 [Bernardetia litoralis DSM 6794]